MKDNSIKAIRLNGNYMLSLKVVDTTGYCVHDILNKTKGHKYTKQMTSVNSGYQLLRWKEIN